MKEYTYTNKAYLGIKEGIVPPAPQYLWLNSKDDKLYKFGDNGWEVIDNAPYVVEEFTARDLASLANRRNPVLTISRDFLDAMYKGLPIMVKTYPTYNTTVPVIVDTIDNPSSGTQFIFRVKFNNIEYKVAATGGVITDTRVLYAVITAHNSVDWNENDSSVTGYIANRTHYHNTLENFLPGDRISITDTEAIHDLNNYRLLVKGDLFKIQEGYFHIEKDGAYIEFNCYRSDSGTTVIWQISSDKYSGFEETEYIKVVSKLGDYKPLDEFYLPDTVKGAYITEFDLKTATSGKDIPITNELIEAVVNGRQILIPYMNNVRYKYFVTVIEGASNLPGESVNLTLKYIHNNKYFTLSVSNKSSQTPVDLVPIIEQVDISQKLKTINNESIVGEGNINVISGLINLGFSNVPIVTVNDDGMLEIAPGRLAGLSTKSLVLSPKDGVISIGPYYRYVCPSVTDNVQIQLDRVTPTENNEWELLFSVNSAESITLDVNYSVNRTIRWKEGEISHSTLSNGYYRLRATYVTSSNEVWAEIDRFN